MKAQYPRPPRPDVRPLPRDFEPSAIIPREGIVPGARITADFKEGVSSGFRCCQLTRVKRGVDHPTYRWVLPGQVVTVVSNDGYNVVVKFEDGQEFATQACQSTSKNFDYNLVKPS